jgi:hypothetical protein
LWRFGARLRHSFSLKLILRAGWPPYVLTFFLEASRWPERLAILMGGRFSWEDELSLIAGQAALLLKLHRIQC